jgi:hypothetical protein
MDASTGKPYGMIGSSEPIIKIHVLDKACIPILLLGYTMLQLIVGIMSRFAVKKGSLFLALSTWFLLCDGQRRYDAAVPFQSLAGHENTVVGIARGDECHEDPSLREYYRPGYSQPGGVFDYKDGFYLGSLCLHSRDVSQHSGFSSLSIPGLVGHPKMSTSGEGSRNDAVTGFGTGGAYIRSSVKSVIKALSGPRFATPSADVGGAAKETDRDFKDPGFSDELLLDGFTSSVSRGNESPGPSEGILRQGASYEHQEVILCQEAPNEEVLRHITNRVDFDGENLQRVADLTGMREITPPFYHEKLRPPACEEISRSGLKPEEDFVPEIRSRFGLTGLTANLSQTEFVWRKIEHGLGFYPDTDSSYPLAGSSSHVLLCSFHPGPNANYGGYHARDASDMGHSTRYGREDTQNVTQRDKKRPKERSRDKAYKTRFSMGSSAGIDRSPAPPFPPSGGRTWPREEGFDPSVPQVSAVFSHVQPQASPLPSLGTRQGARPQAPPDNLFEISLIFEGRSVIHRVWSTMTILQLMADAGSIFGLDPSDIVLVLFSGIPVILHRDATISGPPRISHGSKVMVFVFLVRLMQGPFREMGKDFIMRLQTSLFLNRSIRNC